MTLMVRSKILGEVTLDEVLSHMKRLFDNALIPSLIRIRLDHPSYLDRLPDYVRLTVLDFYFLRKRLPLIARLCGVMPGLSDLQEICSTDGPKYFYKSCILPVLVLEAALELLNQEVMRV